MTARWNVALAVRLEVRPAVVLAEVDGETVLLDTEREHYFGFDEVATAVWHHIDQAPTLQQAVDELADTYGEPAPSIARDVFAFLDELAASGLVDIHQSG